MYKLPERGGGGGEVIWAMPERKHSFFQEVFPNQLKASSCKSHIVPSSVPHWAAAAFLHSFSQNDRARCKHSIAQLYGQMKTVLHSFEHY